MKIASQIFLSLYKEAGEKSLKGDERYSRQANPQPSQWKIFNCQEEEW